MCAAGVEPPFQDVAVDDRGAVQRAVVLALLNGPDVDDERTRCYFVGQVLGSDPIEAGSGGGEHAVYRAHRPSVQRTVTFRMSDFPGKCACSFAGTPRASRHVALEPISPPSRAIVAT